MFIPNYERMIATVVHWLDGHVPAGGLVVDLGAGTGGLSAAILNGLPDVSVQLVDVDPNMLEIAATRCAAHAGRYDLRHARFQDPLPRCQAVVASLALHHVATHTEKRVLYRAISNALEPAGLIVVADALVYPEGPERRRMIEDLYAHMKRNGITAAEADRHLAQWAEEDFYVLLPDEAGTHGRGRVRPPRLLLARRTHRRVRGVQRLLMCCERAAQAAPGVDQYVDAANRRRTRVAIDDRQLRQRAARGRQSTRPRRLRRAEVRPPRRAEGPL